MGCSRRLNFDVEGGKTVLYRPQHAEDSMVDGFGERFGGEGTKVTVCPPQYAEDAMTGASLRGSTSDALIPEHDPSCQTSAGAEDSHPNLFLVDTGRRSEGLRAVNRRRKISISTFVVGSKTAGHGETKRVRKTQANFPTCPDTETLASVDHVPKGKGWCSIKMESLF